MSRLGIFDTADEAVAAARRAIDKSLPGIAPPIIHGSMRGREATRERDRVSQHADVRFKLELSETYLIPAQFPHSCSPSATGGKMMRGTAIMLAATLASASASAQLRSASTAPATTHALVVPVGSCISSPFGPRILPEHPLAGTYHNGVDLPAPEGTPVRAVASGKLLRIEHGGPGGLEVLIQHETYVSVYSHLASVAPSLGRGAIAAGDEVGLVGHTGVSFGPHLFFALLENGRAVDPRPFLGVPLCTGTVHHRTPSEMLAAGEKLPPTRHYYLLSDMPASHHDLTRNGLVDRFCTAAATSPTMGGPGPNRLACSILSW
jgi:murein DD-endopeptidase MepM/ murein hydrolase activator NlpD